VPADGGRSVVASPAVATAGAVPEVSLRATRALVDEKNPATRAFPAPHEARAGAAAGIDQSRARVGRACSAAGSPCVLQWPGRCLDATRGVRVESRTCARRSGERGIRTLDTELPVYALSRRAPSTTRPSLQARSSVGDPYVLRSPGGRKAARSRRGERLRTAIARLTGQVRGIWLPSPLASRSAPIAQLDRASDYGSEGREFESLWAHSESPWKTRGFRTCA
jgi:hypothetical protein